MLEAEGGVFELISGLYTNGKANLNIWLKAWSGEKITVDRRSRDTLHIDAPTLTLCLIPQPDVLRDIGSKPGFRGKGLLGRFLYCLPQSRLGTRKTETQPIPMGVSANYRAMLLRIVDAPWAIDNHGKKTPHTLQLSGSAYRQWAGFAEKVEIELRNGGEFCNMTDWAGKLPGQAIRVTGLFHLVGRESPVSKPISAETMAKALNLSAILTEHAQISFGQMGADPAVECARKILKWISEENIEHFTARDALQIVKGDHRFKKMEPVSRGLSVLEDRAYIRKIETDQLKRRGRKPSQKYKTNPLAHNSQNTQK